MNEYIIDPAEHIRKNDMVIKNAHIFKKYYTNILELALSSNIELDAEVELEKYSITNS